MAEVRRNKLNNPVQMMRDTTQQRRSDITGNRRHNFQTGKCEAGDSNLLPAISCEAAEEGEGGRGRRGVWGVGKEERKGRGRGGEERGVKVGMREREGVQNIGEMELGGEGMGEEERGKER